MGKRVRRASEQEQTKVDSNLEDRISLLPDEILVFILSLLRLKEAAVTSLLSRRWRFLWAFITRLGFDAAETLEKVEMNHKLFQMERLKYVNWVNQVVGLHKSPAVEEFRVCFDLDKSSKNDIDKWLKFALARRVQVLELDLSPFYGSGIRRHVKSYTFPYKMLSQSKGTSLKKLPLNFCIMHRCTFVGLKHLKVLCLKCVNVTGEVLEYFLSNCSALERLCVHGSGELVNLKVAGPSLVLKYLEITACCNIKSIEICNMNLISFTYKGDEISLLLENVPLLVELSIGGRVSRSLRNFFQQLSCCLSQLQTLTLETIDSKEIAGFHVSPELTSLKKFVLNSLLFYDEGLLGYTSFIEASPFLQKFVLQTKCVRPSIDKREVRKAVECPHQYLEEVEFAGYYGRKSDVELVMYILENAVALKKIVIDPRNQMSSETPKEIEEIEEEKAARRRAKQQLEGKVPAGIDLVIL